MVILPVLVVLILNTKVVLAGMEKLDAKDHKPLPSSKHILPELYRKLQSEGYNNTSQGCAVGDVMSTKTLSDVLFVVKEKYVTGELPGYPVQVTDVAVEDDVA